MRAMRIVSALSAFVVLAPALAAAGSNPGRTYLASITDIPLRQNEYVESFKIETWGVQVVAICHFPPGWSVNAGNTAARDGVLEGEASHGVTFLDQKRLDELRGIALITLYDEVQKQEFRSGAHIVPATFSGRAQLGVYGGDEKGEGREVGLDYRNISLTPATRCPAPPTE